MLYTGKWLRYHIWTMVDSDGHGWGAVFRVGGVAQGDVSSRLQGPGPKVSGIAWGSEGCRER